MGRRRSNYQNPDAPQDTRYVYGACCTWHGSIYEVADTEPTDVTINGRTTRGVSIPCCPHCSGPLMEYPDRAKWDANAKHFAEKNNMPLYEKWLESLRQSPCRPLDNWDWRADYQKFAESQ